MFKMLGDHLGKFVDADYSYKIIGEMDVAHILVLLDLWEGLALDIYLNMVYGDVI